MSHFKKGDEVVSQWWDNGGEKFKVVKKTKEMVLVENKDRQMLRPEKDLSLTVPPNEVA